MLQNVYFFQNGLLLLFQLRGKSRLCHQQLIQIPTTASPSMWRPAGSKVVRAFLIFVKLDYDQFGLFLKVANFTTNVNQILLLERVELLKYKVLWQFFGNFWTQLAFFLFHHLVTLDGDIKRQTRYNMTWNMLFLICAG